MNKTGYTQTLNPTSQKAGYTGREVGEQPQYTAAPPESSRQWRFSPVGLSRSLCVVCVSRMNGRKVGTDTFVGHVTLFCFSSVFKRKSSVDVYVPDPSKAPPHPEAHGLNSARAHTCIPKHSTLKYESETCAGPGS